MNRVRRPLVTGNWKMFHGGATGCSLAAEVAKAVREFSSVDVVVAPPFTALAAIAAELDGTKVTVAAQTVHEKSDGAFTGEISAPMLVEAGAAWVILGHSERRTLFGETDAMIAAKGAAALAAKLRPILCLGETLEQRDAGETLTVLRRQLEAMLPVLTSAPADGRCVLAYEPVWAIGTGRTASPEQAEEAHGFLRRRLGEVSASIAETTHLLYGGSVKADNAMALFACANIDGALVGGASLQSATFAPIVQAAERTIRG